MRKARQSLVVVGGLGLLALAAVAVRGEPPVHRNPLGVGELQLQRGISTVKFDEREHGFSREYAHQGDYSETIKITAAAADPVAKPQVLYIYDLNNRARAPIVPELKAGLWLRSKTTGVQLLARVVLPRMPHPQRSNEPYTTLIEGAQYTNANNWQRLELGNVTAALAKRVTGLRLEMGTEIETTGAYVDQLVLNLYSGTGEMQVWVNEIEISPVTENRAAPAATNTPRPNASTKRRGGLVEINRDQLLVDGKRFFFRGIRLTDTPLMAHKLAGFNSVFVEPDAPAALLDEIAKQELFAIPTLSLPGLDGRSTSLRAGEELSREQVTRFQNAERILFWHLGSGRAAEDVERVAKAAAIVREIDPDRPVGVNAWDGLSPYSRNVDLLGLHRWPLHTSLELSKYRDWLTQRRVLARSGTFAWTWIQTHLPDWHTALVYGQSPSQPFNEPIGPQPEQIRLLTYIALSAGCRGIGYWSDRFLAETHHGRDRLLAVALLNLEMQLLEPVLLAVLKGPVWIDTSNPQVKAAVLYGDKGILVLPIWLGSGSQYVPGQAAASGLRIVVPMVPPNYQPWDVSPAEVRSLVPRRVAGGMEVVLPDFGLTASVVFTGDVSGNSPLVFWQEECRRLAKPAAEWSIELARVELEKVLEVYTKLTKLAPPITGADVLLHDADQRLKAAQAFQQMGRFREAYHEANRAQRPLRQLMRLQWDQAVGTVGMPTASPYAVSYFTLPRHWTFFNALKAATAGDNALRGGGFEGAPDPAWNVTEITLDEVALTARLHTPKPREGTQYLELNVQPKNPTAKIVALERTFLAVKSPPVKLQPGTLVRISTWIRIPTAITASADGALFYDSVGGEPLSIRLSEPTDWKQYTLYRRTPASGEISVTLALTGIGTIQFDDVRIEPMYENKK